MRPPSTSREDAKVTWKPEALGELGRHERRFAVGGGHAGQDQVHRAVRADVADAAASASDVAAASDPARASSVR